MANSDELLIDQIRAGDPDAWQQLIDRYEGRLLAFVTARLHDRSDCEAAQSCRQPVTYCRSSSVSSGAKDSTSAS